MKSPSALSRFCHPHTSGVSLLKSRYPEDRCVPFLDGRGWGRTSDSPLISSAGASQPPTTLHQGRRNHSASGRKLICFILLVLLGLSACDYGRMKDDEALQTFERSLPEMPRKVIPVSGGIQTLRTANPQELHNPISRSREAADHGKERYAFYCAQCHGPWADGYGTVGQSFAPLPTNLKSAEVQKQSDGEIFCRISLGYKRHPPLWDTVSEEDRWAIILFIRSLAEQTAS